MMVSLGILLLNTAVRPHSLHFGSVELLISLSFILSAYTKAVGIIIISSIHLQDHLRD
jgi:hypothetical protein